ncbi:LAME_0B03884g1_1 [Lachancea meyersii CBS 8951]|uniref:Biogenesis of lysosome-related organelles complex 1 subunit KXD1 n=1 Tax=Lachancea meyersii CBS 8951 TaxID=1266667 RepID=A0A1G4IUZ9_9SACH|nr:LAME_0B03884g1_1 [Lachancea meyersii CBS 8951]
MSDVGSSDLGSRSRTASIDSQMYAIPAPSGAGSPLSMSSSSSSDIDSDDEDDGDDGDERAEGDDTPLVLDRLARPLDAPVFDVARFVFQSLSHALDSTDFAQATAIQTRTAGLINARSRELEQLVEALQQRLPRLETRFAQGARVARQIKRRLERCNEVVELLGRAFQREHPIEFQQAREEVYEREENEE